MVSGNSGNYVIWAIVIVIAAYVASQIPAIFSALSAKLKPATVIN